MARKQEIEAAIGDFIRLYRGNSGPKIPPPDGPRALLKAKLAQLAQREGPWWFRDFALRPAFAIGLLALGLGLIAYLISAPWAARQDAPPVVVSIPNPGLTPGATVLLRAEQVCRESNTKNKAVPLAVQRAVFDEYGIHAAEPSAYEVDYLITPALGGADDIHNLWPQSYKATPWNAEVKDALEDRLRELVCGGKLDLAIAQREIATNWIEAYQKYFHTDRPLIVLTDGLADLDASIRPARRPIQFELKLTL